MSEPTRKPLLRGRDLGIPRMVHFPRRDRLSPAALELLEEGFRTRRPYGVLCREVAEKCGEHVSPSSVARWGMRWRAARQLQSVSGECRPFDRSVLEGVDASPGFYSRRRRRVWLMLRAYFNNPGLETLRPLVDEGLRYGLEFTLASAGKRDPNTAGDAGGGHSA